MFGPTLLLGLQLLNAWSFAVVAGVGLPLFQQIIARPGLASGPYTNTRRLGAVASGPLLALGAAPVLGYSAVSAGCAVLSVLALAPLTIGPRESRRLHPAPVAFPHKP